MPPGVCAPTVPCGEWAHDLAFPLARTFFFFSSDSQQWSLPNMETGHGGRGIPTAFKMYVLGPFLFHSLLLCDVRLPRRILMEQHRWGQGSSLRGAVNMSCQAGQASEIAAHPRRCRRLTEDIFAGRRSTDICSGRAQANANLSRDGTACDTVFSPLDGTYLYR